MCALWEAEATAGMAGELNDIVARLERSLAPLVGAPRELDGGITNRNYRVTLGELDYVVRLPGKDTELLGIDRAAELLANETAAALGIAPEVVEVLDGCLVTRFLACSAPARGALAADVEEIARALRAFHDSDVRLPTRFSVPELLEDYATIVAGRGGELPLEYSSARIAAARIAGALGAGEARPCHNDLLPGNVIRTLAESRIMLVDWEYAGMGDARFDLGNAVGQQRLRRGDRRAPADGLRRRAPVGRAPRGLRLMRVMSDAREAAWGVVQAAISELDFDFDSYAAEHFERLREATHGAGLRRVARVRARGTRARRRPSREGRWSGRVSCPSARVS